MPCSDHSRAPLHTAAHCRQIKDPRLLTRSHTASAHNPAHDGDVTWPYSHDDVLRPHQPRRCTCSLTPMHMATSGVLAEAQPLGRKHSVPPPTCPTHSAVSPSCATRAASDAQSGAGKDGRCVPSRTVGQHDLQRTAVVTVQPASMLCSATLAAERLPTLTRSRGPLALQPRGKEPHHHENVT